MTTRMPHNEKIAEENKLHYRINKIIRDLDMTKELSSVPVQAADDISIAIEYLSYAEEQLMHENL